MQIGYIYKFHNKITDKVYIGQTLRTLNERIGEHLYEALNNKDNNYFHNALNKYGIENFDICILHTVDAPDKQSLIDKLNILEVQEICNYNSFQEGYNANTGGNSYQVSEESRKKMSKASKGRIFTEEHKQNLSKSLTGKKKSPRSEEHLRKLKESLKDRDLSYLRTSEIRKKASNSNRGQKRSDETKLKMSQAQKGRKVSEETKNKLRDINLGNKHSQETKEKLRLKAIEQWNKRKEESQKNKVLQYKIKGGK